MFKTMINAWKTPEVRKKLLYTLLLIVVFRFGCFITVPGVDIFTLEEQMANSTNTALGLINTISGGAFSRLSVFAMSITPYITAQIVIQLLGIVIPSLGNLIKEGGEEGRIKVNMYQKLLTLVLAIVEGLGIFLSYRSSGIFLNTGVLGGLLTIVSFMAGTTFLIWLGEQITNKGIGNGISMLIFVNIISQLPSSLSSIYSILFGTGSFSTQNLIIALAVIIGSILLVAGVVWIQNAERRIPVQYAKKVVGRKMVGAQNTHIPLKLVMAGVMPIIFASSFMTFPAMIIQLFNRNIAEATGFLAGLYKLSIATSTSSVGWQYSLANALIYLLLILGFTYFYTYTMFNPAEISSTIKRNGGFIPGIRAGKPTTDYLSSVISKITLVGGIFLAIIAIIPMAARFTGLNLAFGGTSILIVVGVALETLQQLESQLVTRHYKGFLQK